MKPESTNKIVIPLDESFLESVVKADEKLNLPEAQKGHKSAAVVEVYSQDMGASTDDSNPPDF